MRHRIHAFTIALAIAALAAPAAGAMPVREHVNAGVPAGGRPPLTYVAGKHRALPEWSSLPRPVAPAEPLETVVSSPHGGGSPWTLIALLLAGAALALALVSAGISLHRRTHRPGIAH